MCVPGIDRPVPSVAGLRRAPRIQQHPAKETKNVSDTKLDTSWADSIELPPPGNMRAAGEAGAGVLLISSDLPEILHLPNRAYVMYRGELRAELPKNQINEQAVLGHFFEKQTV